MREAMRLLGETHGTRPGAFRGATISALTAIAADKGFARERLRAVMAKSDPDKLYGEALVSAGSSGGRTLSSALERLLRSKMK